MNKYKSLEDFTDHSGNAIFKNDIVEECDYRNLRFNERLKFVKVDDEEEGHIVLDDGSLSEVEDSTQQSVTDWLSDSPPIDDDNFQGFDEGDSGGAGAQDTW